MPNEPVPVTVRILDKEYRVACSDDERSALEAAARHLDAKMKEIRDAGKVVGMDRIAVMAALNITHELLSSRSEVDNISQGVNDRLRTLRDKVDQAISQAQK